MSYPKFIGSTVYIIHFSCCCLYFMSTRYTKKPIAFILTDFDIPKWYKKDFSPSKRFTYSLIRLFHFFICLFLPHIFFLLFCLSLALNPTVDYTRCEQFKMWWRPMWCFMMRFWWSSSCGTHSKLMCIRRNEADCLHTNSSSRCSIQNTTQHVAHFAI